MSTHVLTRPDGKSYYLTLSAGQAAEIRGDIVHGNPVQVKEDLFSGRGCKLDAITGNPGYGPHSGESDWVELAAGQLPLGPGHKPGFWQEVVGVNLERRRRGKKWLMNAEILPLKRQCPDMGGGDILALWEWQRP